MSRVAKVNRKTSEVEVSVNLDIDGIGKYSIDTGVPFFNHMLEQLSKHGYFDIEIKAIGDTDIDFHHTVEDVGIALGEAFDKALGDKKSIKRYLIYILLDVHISPYFNTEICLMNVFINIKITFHRL